MRLITAGFDLFPSFVAADLDLHLKTDINGQLPLVLVYKKEVSSAHRMAEQLRKLAFIRKFPIHVEVLSYKELTTHQNSIAAIFLIEQIKDDLKLIVDFAIKNQILMFSPFSEDIEQGVMAGISIQDRILPVINMTTLRQTHTRIKPFFLDVSKHYEYE